MAKDISELETLIAEKNRILSSLRSEDASDREKIHAVRRELDRALYLYYKSLISSRFGQSRKRVEFEFQY